MQIAGISNTADLYEGCNPVFKCRAKFYFLIIKGALGRTELYQAKVLVTQDDLPLSL